MTTPRRLAAFVLLLRPGTYAVRLTLAGFNTFVRDGLELPTDFTATINVEMRVGIVEETVTVTGESPIVDVSSTARVQVLNREALDALPTGQSFNVFNASTEVSYRSTLYNTAAYLQPSSVLQGRMLRLGVQLQW